MHILAINPNTSVELSNRISAVAQEFAASQTNVTVLTAKTGVPYISNRAEALIGGVALLELLAEHHSKFDAVIVAAFGDPGLAGARELFPIPVIGLAEAGMLAACMLGRRFGIVTFTPALKPWYEECVEWHKLTDRCSGVYCIDAQLNSFSTLQEQNFDSMVCESRRAVETSGAEVIVLGGSPLTGLARAIASEVPVPVVDCVGAAVKMAETLVALSPRKATVGTFSRPGPKDSIGLSESLADWLRHGGEADLRRVI